MMMILQVAMLIFMLISLIAYLLQRANMNNDHKEIVASLSPSRYLEIDEIEKFEKLYKKKLPEKTAVYAYRAMVEQFVTETNGAKTYEYSVGGVKIATRAVNKLAKEKTAIDITKHLPDNAQVEKMVTHLKEKLERKEITEEEFNSELQNYIDTTYCHDTEFVFLKEKTNKPAYIVAFKEWKLTAM